MRSNAGGYFPHPFVNGGEIGKAPLVSIAKIEFGKIWNAESARACLIERALLEPEFASSEVDRYLGIPGQAISYKVGERVWMEVREAAKGRLGSTFDLKGFHAHALGMGPMGLDPFAAEMALWK